MTAPMQPAQTSARQFDPNSLNDWINVLHHAASVPDGHADYAEAQAVKTEALSRIDHLNRAANMQDRNAADTQAPTGLLASTVLPAMHGVSLGVGEPIAGAGSALMGGSFREGAQQYREGMDRLQASHPTAAATAELAGMVAPISGPAKAAVGTIDAGVPLTLAQSVGRLLRGSATGATLGGVSGFATGGADPGSLDQRMDAAATGAKTGAVVGGIATGGAMYLGRHAAERAADLTKRADERRATSLKAELLQEKLNKARAPEPIVEAPAATITATERAAVHPDVVQATRDFEAGKITGDDLRTAMDFARNGRLEPEAMATKAADLRRTVGAKLAKPAVADAVKPDRVRPDIKPRPDMTVTSSPGPYQKAAPDTRMQSMSNNLWTEAVKMSGKEPRLLHDLPTDFLQEQLGLARAFGSGHPESVAAVIAELAKRGVAE